MRAGLFFILVFLVTQTLMRGGDADVYLAAGIPAPDREWLTEDYAAAAAVLSGGKVPLPRRSDSAGKALLDRITSRENLSRYRNKTQPVLVRLTDLVDLIGHLKPIWTLYGTATIEGKQVNDEFIQVAVFLLHGAALETELIAESRPSIPKDDRYEARMNGMRRLHSGITSLFVGIEVLLGESRFTTGNRSFLLKAMVATIDRFKVALSSQARVELSHKLEARKAQFTEPSDQANLEKLLAALAS
jgi:hypothetical protein